MNRKILYGGTAGLAAAALAATLAATGLTARLDAPMLDVCARMSAKPSSATDRVKLILVDQSSLDWGAKQMGLQWPWPREVYGPVLDYLKRNGAKAAMFDVLFTEPSAFGVADDETFGAAIGNFENFAGAVFLGHQTDQTSVWPTEARENPLQVDGLETWLAARPVAAAEWTSEGAAFPVPEIRRAVAWLANVRETPDGDGVFRRTAPLRLFDGRVLPSLGVAGWLSGLPTAAEERAAVPVTATLDGDALTAGGRRIPLDGRGRMILRFRGPSGTHQAFTASSVIQSEMSLREGATPAIADGSVFRDAYVVFGFSAPGLKDLRPTPMGGDYPGAEIHATMVDNLLAGDFLRDTPPAAQWALTVLLALLAGLGAARAGGIRQAGVLLLLAVPPLLSFVAWRSGWVLPPAASLTAVFAALLGGAVVNFLLEGRQKRFLKGAFKHYLSPEVIEQIVRDPSSLKLGGEKRELSIFFSDLQGFSGISERLGPEELTGLLNDYLSDMTDILLEEGGTLDKYEGDAIIAFWNAPASQPDHATRAVRAAVRCQRKLAERRAEFERRTGAVMKMRIGLNSGPVVVGNMGSSQRFDYTMLGDAANLASRLEGANKALGTYLMISEATWMRTGGAFPGRELGELRVVGRKTPVRVFEATGLEGESATPHARAFEAALGLARERRWADAAAAFEALGDEPAARTYAVKCRALADGANPGDWDGIWNLTEK